MPINYIWNCFGVWQQAESKDATYLEAWWKMTRKKTLPVLEWNTGTLGEMTALHEAKWKYLPWLDQGSWAPCPAESITNSRTVAGSVYKPLHVPFLKDTSEHSIILFPLNRVHSLYLFTQHCHYAHKTSSLRQRKNCESFAL